MVLKVQTGNLWCLWEDLGSFITPWCTKSINKIIKISVLNGYLGKSYASKIGSCCLQFHSYGLKWNILFMPRFMAESPGRGHVTHLAQFQAVLNFLHLIYFHWFWNCFGLPIFSYQSINPYNFLNILLWNSSNTEEKNFK